MGIGYAEDCMISALLGADMFDCVLPTRAGRTGLAYTWNGKLNIKNAKYQKDETPLDPNCDVCSLSKYSKGYLNHLIKSNEMMASMLISLNNIYFYQQFMSEIRKSIKEQKFDVFYKKYIRFFE